MRISDWSSDVCSSDLIADKAHSKLNRFVAGTPKYDCSGDRSRAPHFVERMRGNYVEAFRCYSARRHSCERSEEHTSELQSLMRISYAVFCLKKKNRKSTT